MPATQLNNGQCSYNSHTTSATTQHQLGASPDAVRTCVIKAAPAPQAIHQQPNTRSPMPGCCPSYGSHHNRSCRLQMPHESMMMVQVLTCT